jgi:hypothetical protein
MILKISILMLYSKRGFMILNVDCLEYLRECRSYYRTIFADPPDNLGLSYAGYLDKRTDYYEWLESILLYGLNISEVFWLSYYWEHDIEIKYRVRSLLKKVYPSRVCKTFIWHFGFGQYTESDFGSGYRPILRISKPNVKWNFEGIRVPSYRMENNDTRCANLSGKVPDDVWSFSRIMGNHPERQEWHPTQHPMALCSRIAICSGGPVLDLFAGTGTMNRACKALGIPCTGLEISKTYYERLIREHL